MRGIENNDGNLKFECNNYGIGNNQEIVTKYL